MTGRVPVAGVLAAVAAVAAAPAAPGQQPGEVERVPIQLRPPRGQAADPVHFRPARGTFADPVPFFWRGQYHVFYLRGYVPKVPWEHIVSTDLRTWQELPPALEADGPADGPDGKNMFTGCVVEAGGLFHLFYTGWNPDNPRGREWVGHATSRDLVRWTKHPEDMFGPDGRVYANLRDRDFRDPFVFLNPDDGRWWMLLAARAAADNRPVTGVYTSADLVRWEPAAPLCDGYEAAPECPDLFRVGNLWYLIVSPSDNVTRYRTAPDLRGPWSPAPGTPLDTPIFYAAKRQFDGRRHVLTGWVRDLEGDRAGGGFRWGGAQSIPREVFATRGGELLSRPVPEARDAYPEPVLDLAARPPVTTLTPDARPAPGPWRYQGGRLVAEADGMTRARLPVPADYHLTLTARVTGRETGFALLFRQAEVHNVHYRLEVRPGRGEATFATPATDHPRPVPFAPGRDVTIEAFVQGSIIECWVNGGYAFSGRAYENRAGALDMLVMDGRAEVRDLVVRAAGPGPRGRR